MMRALSFVAALLVVAAAGAEARAQSGQNGSIVGNVFDKTGLPLKGVKVVATSETQIGGPKTAYTNDEGYFRFVALLPGQFVVTASAPKMQPQVKSLEVGISAPAEVTFLMDIQTAVEEVQIVERAPMINTKSAAVKETIDIEMIEAMPLESRDNPHNQLIGAVAGAMGKSVRGGKDSQTVFTQDGFDMRDQYPTMKSSAAYEVLTGGHGADAPTASGAAVNLVTKSGSNKFEFQFNATYDSNRLRFFLDEGEGYGDPSYRYVLNPTVAGPILKDRLWFYFNTEMHIIREPRSYDPAGIFPPRPPSEKLINKGSLKVTWQVTSRNRLSSLTNFDLPREYNRKDDLGVDILAQERRIARRLFTGLIWEPVLTDSIVARSQIGVTYFGEHIFPERCVDQPIECEHIKQVVQTTAPRQEWENSSAHNRNDVYTVQMVNRFEWFFGGGATGEHQLQLMSNFLTERDIKRNSTPGDAVIQYNGKDPANETTYFSNDPRLSPARYGWFIQEVNWSRHAASLSDTWRPTRYFTIRPGISHIWGASGNSDGVRAISASAFAPSVSLSWDATHDGRTVLRASGSSYADVEIETLARHRLGSRVSRRCNWDPATETFSSGCAYSGGADQNSTIGLPCGPLGVDDQGRSCRTELGIPRTHEATLGAEREVVQGLAIALDGIYRRYVNQYDTRETNRRWNLSGTALDPIGAFRNGRSQSVSDLGTPDYMNRRYMGATLGVRKREGRMKAQASYTLSHLVGAAGDYGDNPGQDIYLYGYLGDDHRHEIKAMAQYSVLRWLTTGIRYNYHSGTPYNRMYRNAVTNGFDDTRANPGFNPNMNVNDPADDRESRLPDIQSLNVQARLNLQPFIGQRLDFYVDVLNVLAQRTSTGVITQDGPRFGTPSGSRQGPFRIRFGMNYRY